MEILRVSISFPSRPLSAGLRPSSASSRRARLHMCMLDLKSNKNIFFLFIYLYKELSKCFETSFTALVIHPYFSPPFFFLFFLILSLCIHGNSNEQQYNVQMLTSSSLCYFFFFFSSHLRFDEVLPRRERAIAPRTRGGASPRRAFVSLLLGQLSIRFFYSTRFST